MKKFNPGETAIINANNSGHQFSPLAQVIILSVHKPPKQPVRYLCINTQKKEWYCLASDFKKTIKPTQKQKSNENRIN